MEIYHLGKLMNHLLEMISFLSHIKRQIENKKALDNDARNGKLF